MGSRSRSANTSSTSTRASQTTVGPDGVLLGAGASFDDSETTNIDNSVSVTETNNTSLTEIIDARQDNRTNIDARQDNRTTTIVDDRDVTNLDHSQTTMIDGRTYVTGTDAETALAAIESQNSFLSGLANQYDSMLESQTAQNLTSLEAIERISNVAISNAHEAVEAAGALTGELLSKNFGGAAEAYVDPVFGSADASAKTDADDAAPSLGGLPSGPVVVGTLLSLAVLALAA